MTTQLKEKFKPDFPRSTFYAFAGGISALLLTVFIYFGLQRIFQNLPIYQILGAMRGTSNTLCFAGITASSTILPLMLTIFSFARRSEGKFNPWFYQRIKNIALLCCVAFVTGLFTLTVLSAPISDMSEVSDVWYRVFYYVIVGGLASMVGTLIAILIMLFYSILHIINRLNPLEQ
ncbi:MAG: hypothetical protein KC496_10900 [Anaerolineae bacterium]|nr:hypothetical protein [Anaerolineae bacterium]